RLSFATPVVPPHPSPLSLHDALPILVHLARVSRPSTPEMSMVRTVQPFSTRTCGQHFVLPLPALPSPSGQLSHRPPPTGLGAGGDRKSTRLNSSHGSNTYARLFLNQK